MTDDEMVKSLEAKGYKIEAPRKARDWNSLTPEEQKYEQFRRAQFMGGEGDEVWD